jgi:3-hydroxybutyryl-CoA dehydrogenase
MKILIIGEEVSRKEFQQKFGSAHEYTLLDDYSVAAKFLGNSDLVFDFMIDEEPEEFEMYLHHPGTVFLNAAKISIGELIHLAGNRARIDATLFGFNGLPGFLGRTIFEVSLWNKADDSKLRQICASLNTEYFLVDDRIGMVTPRVVCMIINEAYFAVQEGTASKQDIDLAMKSGTNYPYGPFEWCERIGIRHVYELLEALYNDTKDERYKVCPLLKKEYLKNG